MSTRYESQLNHIGFDWCRQSKRFHWELLARETVVLDKLGFYREYGSLDDPTFTGHIEAIHLMEEISGLLSQIAAITIDGGFKAPHQIIATLKPVKADPSLILTHALESEALGVLASCYQRAAEAPGTFWFDIDRPQNGPLPDLNRVRAAASKAILTLKSEAVRGRRKDLAVQYAAQRFREIFLRFNEAITRHSIDSSRNGKRIQIEAGPFVEFLEEVLAPLNRFFVKLPKDYGARPISAGFVAQVAKKLDPRNCHHNFHRKPRFSLPFNRRVRIAHYVTERQMSEIFTAEHLETYLEVPDAFIPLVLATPRLLPGETDDDYFRLFEMMLNELLPKTDMEWLWTIELAWLWFEIYRYRRWKNAIILINRAAAVEKALSKTNPAAQEIGVTSTIRVQARLESQALRANPKDRTLNARLQEYGYDSDAINAAAFVDGMMSLTMIEKFLASARQQASTMLREAALRRDFVRRATQADWCFQDEERARKASAGAQTGKPAEVTQSS